MEVLFEPVKNDHMPMLEDWLARPHWREWWGDPENELGYIREMIEGRDTSKPFIFHVCGEPAGYIQYWFLGYHQTPEWIADYPWLAELPSDSIGVDLSIADASRLSEGVGSYVLKTFSERLAAKGFKTIIIDPDPENGRAVRAYEKAGFRRVPELIGKTGDCLIMRFEPTTSE